jgi:hypothetical protein
LRVARAKPSRRTHHISSQQRAVSTSVVARCTRKTTSPHTAYFIQTTGGQHAQTTLPRTSHFITTTSGQHIHSCALHAQQVRYYALQIDVIRAVFVVNA